METYVITGSLAAEFKKFLQAKVDAKVARRLRDLPGPQKVSIHMIKQVVSDKYVPIGRSIEDNCNERRLVRARNIAMYLAKRLTAMSYPAIAEAFGGKHHTTVMYGVRQIREEINQDPLFSIEMSDLESELKA